MRRWSRFSTLVAILVVGVLSIQNSVPAYAYSYFGAGWWQKTLLLVYHFGPTDAGYLDAQYNARQDWWSRSARLQLWQSFDSGHYDIGTVADYYGSAFGYGYAYICAPDVQHCYSYADTNTTYVYAEARLNRSAGIDGWELAKKQAAFAHELGHTLSLAHNGGCETSLMHPHIGWDGFPPHPGFYDRGIRGPTQDEIDGINNRY